MSRETFLLANSLLLAVSTATILLGTIYPLLLDALFSRKISVGPPYFNLVFGLLMVPLALTLGLGQFARWREEQLGRLWHDLRYAAGAALLVCIVLAVLIDGPSRVTAAIGVALAVWIAGSTLVGLWLRCAGRASPLAALRAQPRSFVGQAVAHLGFAVTIAGVCLTGALTVDRHDRMSPGDTATVGDYEFRFESLHEYAGPNYQADEARFTIHRDGKLVAELHPQKRFYKVRGMPMTEAGIDPGFTRDLYVSLGEPLEGNAWSVRMHYKAYVRWIWLGALLMAAGGLLAATDRRYRQTVAAAAPAGIATQDA